MGRFFKRRDRVGVTSGVPGAATHGRGRRRGASLERLEGRTLLAADLITIGAANALSFLGSADDGDVTVSFDAGTYTFVENNGEVIDVTNNGTATVGGAGTNTVTVSGIVSLAFDTGGGADTLRIRSNNDPTTVANTTSNDVQTVIVGGAADGVGGIAGPVSVSNATSTTDLTVDDSAGNSPANATIDNAQVTGLAPATISYDETTLDSLTVKGGGAGNTFLVAGTPSGALAATTTTLDSGVGGDSVDVTGTALFTSLTINGQAGTDRVRIGLGDTTSILGDVDLTNAAGLIDLTIDDSADAADLNVTVSKLAGVYVFDGLTPSTVTAPDAAVLRTVTLRGGVGNNDYLIEDTPNSAATRLETGAGSSFVTVRATGTDPIPALGANLAILGRGTNADAVRIGETAPGVGLKNIRGSIRVDGENPRNLGLTLDDASASVDRDVTLAAVGTDGAFTFGDASTPARISYRRDALSELAYAGGSANNTLTVDFDAGNPIPQANTFGFQFDGGGGPLVANVLNLTGGTGFTNETCQATGPGSGTITLDDTHIGFTGLSPVHDTVPALNFTASASSNTSQLADGPTVGGVKTAEFRSGDTPQSFERIAFANKGHVTINASGISPNGTAFLLNQTTRVAGLLNVVVNTGSGADTVFVTATPPNVGIAVNTQGQDDTVNVRAAGLGQGPTSSFFADGGTGANTLNVDASGEAGVNTSTPGNISFGPGTTTIVYANFQQVRITSVPSKPPVGGAPVTFTAVAGQSVIDQAVATFTDADASSRAENFVATIAWGDGTSSAGTITQDASTPSLFYVTGTHKYTAGGTFTVTVTARNQGGTFTTIAAGVSTTVVTLPGPAVALSPTGTARVSELAASGVSVAATAGEPLPDSTVVATFTDTVAGRPASSYTATIDWGDGSPLSGGTVKVNPNGPGLVVVGTHTYRASGSFTITTSIVSAGGARASATSTATVRDVPIALAGQLNPATDTGQSHTDGITSVAQPDFFGTTSPHATIQLFAQPTGGGARVRIGAGTADSAGSWNVASNLLADGSYTITAEATSATGQTKATTQLLPGAGRGPLVIDTVGPKVTAVSSVRGLGQINITFQDDRSGMDQSTVLDASNYSLNRPRARPGAFLVNVLSSSPNGPTGPDNVVATINGGRKLRRGAYTLTISGTSSILDVAGNRLDGEFYGTFPSGNGQNGGNFVAQLDAVHGRVSPPRTVIGSARPVPPTGAGAAFLPNSNPQQAFQPGARRFAAANRPGPATLAAHDLAMSKARIAIRGRHGHR